MSLSIPSNLTLSLVLYLLIKLGGHVRPPEIIDVRLLSLLETDAIKKGTYPRRHRAFTKQIWYSPGSCDIIVLDVFYDIFRDLFVKFESPRAVDGRGLVITKHENSLIHRFSPGVVGYEKRVFLYQFETPIGVGNVDIRVVDPKGGHVVASWKLVVHRDVEPLLAPRRMLLDYPLHNLVPSQDGVLVVLADDVLTIADSLQLDVESIKLFVAYFRLPVLSVVVIKIGIILFLVMFQTAVG